MFENLEAAPPDPILGLTAAFKEDANPDKLNLGVGVYCDGDGKTPVLASVLEAERRLLERGDSKTYLPIDGSPEYGEAVRQLVFGSGNNARRVTVQGPGGTGALRVAGDFLHQLYPGARLWLSAPTWANHPKVFASAGLETAEYPYFEAATNGLDFDRMLAGLEAVPAGDVVLLHGCCHNPTGVDPSADQWRRLAEVLAERRIIPLVDFAYQGLGDGLDADAAGLRVLCDLVPECLVASSFSKNFGLYKERVGALTVQAASAAAAAAVLSHLKVCIRTNFSNPPAHGSAIVTTVLQDGQLRQQWEAEVAAMRERINGMRRTFVARLAERGVARDFSFIERQRGMFSFSGLSADQVARLRQEYSIYIVGSGRINVAGITDRSVDRLCDAIAAVL